MRLFVAFDIPDSVKEYLSGVQEGIGDDLAGITWVKPEHIHLTLKFLGEVQPHIAEKAGEMLRKISSGPFGTSLGKMGVFPNENYIRVVWVGLEPDEYTVGLQKLIDEGLKELFKKERDFKAHLTLGRIKHVENREKFLSRLNGIKIERRKFGVDSFKLMRSTLTRDGPVYDAVEEFKLRK